MTLRTSHYEGINELDRVILPTRARALTESYAELAQVGFSEEEVAIRVYRMAITLSTTDSFTSLEALGDAVMHGLNMLWLCIDREQKDLCRIVTDGLHQPIPADMLHYEGESYWVASP